MNAKKTIAGILCTCSVVSGITAAQAAETGTAQVWEKPYYVEGQVVGCKSADGKLMPLLNYDGNIYIPLRTAGEWMGKQVDWNAETHTISLSGTVTPSYCTDFDRGHDWTDLTPQVTIDPDISVVVDGKKQELRAADGAVVYPLLYDNTSYLPMRAIGELIDKEVTYVQFGGRADQPEIYIRTPLTDAQKTEAVEYVNQAIQSMRDILQAKRELYALPNDTPAQTALTKLDELQKCIETFKAVKQPAAPVTHANYARIQEDLDFMLKNVAETQKRLQSAKTFSEILDFLTEDVDGGSSRSLIMQGEPSPAGIIVRMYITVTQDGTPCENWAE